MLELIFFRKKKFLAAIRGQRAIWDRENPHYGDRGKRAQAWEKVAEAVFGRSFKTLSEEEKQRVHIVVRTRWRHLRILFLSVLIRKKKGQKLNASMKSLYNHMSFLTGTNANGRPIWRPSSVAPQSFFEFLAAEVESGDEMDMEDLDEAIRNLELSSPERSDENTIFSRRLTDVTQTNPDNRKTEFGSIQVATREYRI